MSSEARSNSHGVAQLDLDSTPTQTKSAMLDANKKFNTLEKRKEYKDHVTQGKRKGIYFENEVKSGEDRDGDGIPDNGRSRRQQGGRR